MVPLTAPELGVPSPTPRFLERHVFELPGTIVSLRLQQLWLSEAI